MGIAVHPVQAYAAFGMLVVAIALVAVLYLPHRAGDAAGIGLMGGGVTLFITEFWRDWEGRGAILHGALNGPQIAAIVFILLGALLLSEWRRKGSAHA